MGGLGLGNDLQRQKKGPWSLGERKARIHTSREREGKCEGVQERKRTRAVIGGITPPGLAAFLGLELEHN